MKKITAVLLTLILCFGTVACGRQDSKITPPTMPYSAEEATTDNLIDTPEIMESTIIDTKNQGSTDKKMIITGTPDPRAKSGFAPLAKITYTATDPDNTRGLSTTKISHSHGPASGGKAHYTVVEF